ncbi:MAG: hypothetical protein H0V09_11265 [Gemmatimonadetes bacterium]|nr:hypothetical protein [Gemmatimonadota bacterium]
MRVSSFLPAVAVALAFGVATPASGAGAGVADSTAMVVLQAMHDRYDGRWPRNVTFVQTSTFHEPDGKTRQETWYEATAPGVLRIDIAPVDSGNGIVFRNDSIYQFKRDSLVAAVAQMHPLMVLSRDVYEIPVERTAEKLRALGFDLGKLREDMWQGRPVYVIGAVAGDEKSAQFWIEKENLLFVRLLQPSKKDAAVMEEIRFNKYRPLGAGWIETEVDFLVNGKRVFFEEYRDIRRDVEFAPELFDPRRWGRPAWVEEAGASGEQGS